MLSLLPSAFFCILEFDILKGDFDKASKSWHSTTKRTVVCGWAGSNKDDFNFFRNGFTGVKKNGSLWLIISDHSGSLPLEVFIHLWYVTA